MDNVVAASTPIGSYSLQGMTPTMIVLHGNQILSAITDIENGAEQWPRIAIGYYDALLLHTFFHAHHQRHPVDGEEAQDEDALRGLGNAKQYLRNILEAALDPEAFLNKRFDLDNPQMEQCKAGLHGVWADQRRAKQDTKQQQKKARDAFVSQHAVAPEGTVGELAEKYRKSKSEIRRLKAAGLLHTLGQP